MILVNIVMVLFLAAIPVVPSLIARRRDCEAALTINYWSKLALAVGLWPVVLVDKQMLRNEAAGLGLLSQFEITDVFVPAAATLVAWIAMIAWASFGKRWAKGSPPE